MIRRVLVAFLVFGLVACGDDGMGVEDIVGNYLLQSIDGEELPVTKGGTTTTAGSVHFKQDMTCSFIQTATVEIGGSATTFSSTQMGTYTFNSGALTLTLGAGNNPLVGSISGSTLTLPALGRVYVLQN